MYKLLLCWRYLRTRYIALASIISVTLGVATMIVVNAVMSGFSHEMEDRMHGVLSDVVLEGHGMENIENPQFVMDTIRMLAGNSIAGMTPTVHVPGILTFRANGQDHSQQIMFIGIDEATYASVSDFSKYLNHSDNREHLSFKLREDGYDVRDHQLQDKAPLRLGMEQAGWQRRRLAAERQKAWEEQQSHEMPIRESTPDSAENQNQDSINHRADAESQNLQKHPATAAAKQDPFGPQQYVPFDPAKEQHPGVIPGIALASGRDHEGNDHFFLLPGDDVRITIPTAGTQIKGQDWPFTVVDFYESKMSEYDSSFVFVPIKELQEMRGIGTNVSAIQIKLKPGIDPDTVRDQLRSKFPPELFGVYTWRDKQGALLAAVQMERAVLNILLFMIIAVAGFGILAIFFMIVVEKTRDVGILKSLGASSRGILGIFLGYGLSLGLVGAGVGMAIGLLFVHYINQIRDALEWVTGQPVFDPAIYYFYEIPTIIDPVTVTWIVVGALSIAVLASVLPALRAARLHPVEALRYE
ncbi:MAG TPA: FtsX-like permease family protein [Pirellulales bacterium]|jgi:lipoprotein-releasing system permease protein|nr:FtsX-like permease family protein [Pirellulales bacterium]